MTTQIERYQYLVPNVIEEEKNSLRDVLGVLFRHRKTIFIFFTVVVATVASVTFLMPRTYQSDAKLLLRVGRESVSMDPSVMGPTISLAESRENEMNSELAILRSRAVVERAVERFGPENYLAGMIDAKRLAEPYHISGWDAREVKSILAGDPSVGSSRSSVELTPKDRAIKLVTNQLKVDVEPKSHIINLGLQGADPQLVQAMLGNLLDVYLEHHIYAYKQSNPKLLQEQAQTLLESLTGKERELEQFRSAHGIVSVTKQREALQLQTDTLQKELDDSQSQISVSQAKIGSFEKSLQGRSETRVLSKVEGRATIASDTMKQKLNELKMREVDMRTRYRDDDRILGPIRDHIRQAEDAVRKEKEPSEVTLGIDANYQALKLSLDTERATYQAQLARHQSLSEELRKRKAQMSSLSEQEVTEKRLQREVETLQGEYAKYSDNLQRAKISDAFDLDKLSNVSIIQTPSMLKEPVKPKRMLNLALGVFLGLFGGIGLAFFLEFFDHTIRSGEDVEKRLGLPVLVAIASEDYEQCT